MKLVWLESKIRTAANILVNPRFRSTLLSVMVAGSFASAPQAFAAQRVLQVLGACNGGEAEFVGNVKKGRSQLTSFGPDDIAGFFFEGLEGKTVGSLGFAQVFFEVPVDPTTYEVTLRVKVTGKPNKIQNFYVAGAGHPNLPKLPVRPTIREGNFSLDFRAEDLLSEDSKLTASDTIEKVSFIFNSTNKVKGSAIRCEVEHVVYAGQSVPVVLEPVTCNLK